MISDDVGVPTIENAFGVLRQVRGSALEDNRIARNPCDGVKLPRLYCWPMLWSVTAK